MDTEVWKPVVGFEGFYEVSDQGRVRTVARLVNTKGRAFRRVESRIRKPALLNGYPAVNLSINGKTRMRTVHTMVLEAFVGPRPSPQHDGCHDDGGRLNNAVGNLRWDTKKANKADAFKHGVAPIGERVGSAKLSLDQVIALRADERGAGRLVCELGVCASTVKRARNGRTWSRALQAAAGA